MHSIMGILAGLFYRLYSSTWSYRIRFADGSSPIELYTKHPKHSCVFGHWHGDDIALIAGCRKSKLLTIVSPSKDGTIMSAALKVMGIEAVRGSSSRGGMRGLVAMIQKIRKEHFFVTFAMDGPTGPRHVSKPGIHMLALKMGLPIYQSVVQCDRKWVLHNTWHKTYIPKPFAQIRIVLHQLPKPTKANREQLLALLNSRTTVSQ